MERGKDAFSPDAPYARLDFDATAINVDVPRDQADMPDWLVRAVGA